VLKRKNQSNASFYYNFVMSKRRKKSPFGEKKGKNIYQNNPRPKDKDSSGDRKGVIQSVKDALDGRKSEASKTPATTPAPTPATKPTPLPTPQSIAPTKQDFDVDKMLQSQGINIPRSIMGDAATPAAKPTATPAAKPTATPAAKPTATPAPTPTATPAPTPTATPAAKPASPSGGLAKEGTAQGMMQEMGFDLPKTAPKNDEEYKQRFYDFLDRTPKEKLKFPDPKPQEPTKDAFDEAFSELIPPTPSPSTPAAESSDRGLIDGMPTAQALSEVKSRVDGILGASDKAPAKPLTPSPTPYTPPKDEDELKARKGAFKELMDATSYEDSPLVEEYALKTRQDRIQEARQRAIDAGVPEERVDAVINKNNLAPSTRPKLSSLVEETRVEAAAKMDKALVMPQGSERQAALKEARQLAMDDGVSEERVDAYIASRDTPEFRKAQQLKQVREAGRRAAEAGKPKDRFTQFVEGYKKENYGREPSDKEKADWFATEAANLRAQGFTGMDGRGGLAELAQLQADKNSGVAPGTFSALGSSKKIAPDSEIIDSYAQKVADGRMTAEAARRAFGQDMLDKMRYDDPRLFARNEAEYQAAVAEAKRTGAPIPQRPLPGADIDFAALARQVPRKQKPTVIRNSGNFITGFGTKGVYDN
jgi:hypothetical protein